MPRGGAREGSGRPKKSDSLEYILDLVSTINRALSEYGLRSINRVVKEDGSITLEFNFDKSEKKRKRIEE